MSQGQTSSKPFFTTIPPQIKYNLSAAKYIGIVQLIIGTVFVISNTALIGCQVRYFSIALIGYGIWGGIIIIISGSVQVVAGYKFQTKSLMITLMVTSILASIAAVLVFAFSIADIFAAKEQMDFMRLDSVLYQAEKRYADLRIGLGVVLAILGFTELFLGIISSALCCNELCCITQYFPAVYNERDQEVVYFPDRQVPNDQPFTEKA